MRVTRVRARVHVLVPALAFDMGIVQYLVFGTSPVDTYLVKRKMTSILISCVLAFDTHVNRLTDDSDNMLLALKTLGQQLFFYYFVYFLV